MRFEREEMYLKSTGEMEELFGKYPGAIENTQKIADMCQVEFEFGKYHLPLLQLPSNPPWVSQAPWNISEVSQVRSLRCQWPLPS